MAAPIDCDVCRLEPAVQLLTNLGDGTTITLGASCLAVFYHQSLLEMLQAGAHEKIVSKCQTCRRVHEHMTLAYAGPDNTDTTATPATPPDTTGTE